MPHPRVTLYDATNIDKFQWPDTEDGKKAKEYLNALIKNGASPYLKNVSTNLQLASCNEVFLPFTINEKEYENSYITSNYYGIKFYEENISRKYPLLARLQKPLLVLGGKVLQLSKVNKAIFLNNWLMTNSLAPNITNEELQAILSAIIKKFPDHTIFFRHVDTRVKKALLASLKNSQFHLMKTRDVFHYDPEDTSTNTYSMRKTGRKDLRILEKHNLELVSSEEIQETDYARILELYEMIYVNKYTKYSPRYTEEYLKITHKSKMIHYVALKKDGQIVGYFSYFIYNNSVMNTLFGYDITVPYSHDLYKVLTRLVIEESYNHGLIVNDGSGGDVAKLKRGLKPSSEYMGLYCAHLPMPRRLLWNTVAFFYKLLTK